MNGKRRKIAVIGAGNVGAMIASRIIDSGLSDVVLMDIMPGLAKGKALDISDTRPITGSMACIQGTEEFCDTEGSDIVVITAGLTRKPGMSRDDLLQKNAQIVKDISENIKKYCPSAVAIVVTNPLDVMSYLVMKLAGFQPNRVMGMAGVLDLARFINAARGKAGRINDNNFYMMGSHGDSMVAINRSDSIPGDIFEDARSKTTNRGLEIVTYLKAGSAYFAPSAAAFYMVKSVLNDEKKIVCASAYLKGQYGEKDIYMGVPVKLGASGIIEIIEIELTDHERRLFKKSAQDIRENIRKTIEIA